MCKKTFLSAHLKKALSLIALLFVLIFFVLYIHNVPKKLTQEDLIYLEKIVVKTSENVNNISFEEQINIISSIQTNVHKSYSLGNAIEYSTTREPKDLYENKGGICYDFSRTIEKALIYAGFSTRHISLYKKTNTSIFSTILKKSVPSHSSTEVKTSKGWMIVDSNLNWLAIDTSGNVYSAKKINIELSKGEEIIWQTSVFQNYEKFYNTSHYVIYGLYSRHGKFYPPYNFIPDYNFCELFYNFRD